jgi:DinB family protein
MERPELLDREAASWQAFMAAVDRVPVERRAEPGVVPGWSVRDLVWHCGYWADDAARSIEAIGAGGDPEPDEPEDVWQARNDEAAEASKAMSWEEVVSRAEAARERVRAAFASLSQVASSAESEFVEETFEHYDEHAAEVRRFAEGSPGV